MPAHTQPEKRRNVKAKKQGVTSGKDDRGPFFRRGRGGRKFYYVEGDERSARIAREKALGK